MRPQRRAQRLGLQGPGLLRELLSRRWAVTDRSGLAVTQRVTRSRLARVCLSPAW